MNNQITQSPSAPPSDVIMTDVSSSINSQFPKLLKYLSTHTVYEAIPENMKILVFNSELAIKECISAMANEDIYCSLLKFREIYWINDNKRYSDIDEIHL